MDGCRLELQPPAAGSGCPAPIQGRVALLLLVERCQRCCDAVAIANKDSIDVRVLYLYMGEVDFGGEPDQLLYYALHQRRPICHCASISAGATSRSTRYR